MLKGFDLLAEAVLVSFGLLAAYIISLLIAKII